MYVCVCVKISVGIACSLTWRDQIHWSHPRVWHQYPKNAQTEEKEHVMHGYRNEHLFTLPPSFPYLASWGKACGWTVKHETSDCWFVTTEIQGLSIVKKAPIASLTWGSPDSHVIQCPTGVWTHPHTQQPIPDVAPYLVLMMSPLHYRHEEHQPTQTYRSHEQPSPTSIFIKIMKIWQARPSKIFLIYIFCWQ